MSENPNPRGWRSSDGGTFVDLGSVIAVQCFHRHSADRPYGKVWFCGGESIQLLMSEDDQRSLVNAIEIYRSGR